MTHATDRPHESRSTLQLEPAERLLLGCLRSWATGREEGHTPHRAIAQALAWRTSSQVATLFLAWAQAIETGSVRPLVVECPGCGGIAPDLQRLVLACGLAPVADGLGRRLLEPLIAEPAAVMGLARQLNAALAASGWPMPARLPSTPHALPASATVH